MSTKQKPAFQYTAYPKMSMQASMEMARTVLDEAGAMVIDINCFSNKQIVFQVSVRFADWNAFLHAMSGSQLNVETLTECEDVQKLVDEDGDVFGTITVVIRDESDERRDLIPSVPG